MLRMYDVMTYLLRSCSLYIAYAWHKMHYRDIHVASLWRTIFTCKVPTVFLPGLSLVPVFLAHLSQRLICELIVYPWSGVRVVRPSSSTMLKHLLRNCLFDQSQILCGASLGRGN